MGKQLLPKAHIAKWTELTESEITDLTSSTVDEIALAILIRPGSRGITLESSQRKIIFNIQVDQYWLKWQRKRSKLAATDLETSEFHQDRWNRYLMLWSISARIPWNARSYLELRRSYKAFHDDLVLPSATTLCNMCRKESAKTVDAIQKQLPSWNKGYLPFDGWTTQNQLAISSVIAYCLDRPWALHEVRLAFDEVDPLVLSRFES